MREALLNAYPVLKSAHLVFVVAWMAGMMYLPRLFVYHHQAQPGGEAERFFTLMERRLLKGIINPSMVVVWALGGALLYANPGLFSERWFLVKFLLAVGVSAVHGLYAGAFKRFEKGERPRSEKFWRIMNEAPFIMMIVIIVMVIVRPF